MQPNTKYTCLYPVLFFVGIAFTTSIRFLVSKEFWSWLPLIILSIPLISVWYIIRPYYGYKKFRRDQFIENYKKDFDRLESIDDYNKAKSVVDNDESLSVEYKKLLIDHFDDEIELIKWNEYPTEPESSYFGR